MASYSKDKISHTILEFGRKFIALLPEPHQKNELEASMETVVLVWNAVTLDTVHGTTENTDTIFELLKDEPPEYVLHIKRLVMRKKRHFSSDLRGVGRKWIIEKNGELIFGCDARAIAD